MIKGAKIGICKICRVEQNVYYGITNNKDFNICPECYENNPRHYGKRVFGVIENGMPEM